MYTYKAKQFEIVTDPIFSYKLRVLIDLGFNITMERSFLFRGLDFDSTKTTKNFLNHKIPDINFYNGLLKTYKEGTDYSAEIILDDGKGLNLNHLLVNEGLATPT